MHSSTDDLHFRKSSYSSTAQECVEVADMPGGVAMRDTKHRELGHLELPPAEWHAFLASACYDRT
ncbi:DUF397 domain-containing protein [Nocardiopsis sp. EMB25]|uniref:DUF397 domain-containing protein n=1 Tax=Nocardiopsis sp. EMB25 TaxID=2835867 RepID=UPI0022836402|nr:DUF397 domain-containing protein [Nocardiopsis sp. EMB25]MCY9785448.1 DUF397 domain-containing protein [Nocardiopsis sp. EMB25]